MQHPQFTLYLLPQDGLGRQNQSEWSRTMISIQQQTYPHWQLVIPAHGFERLPTNLHPRIHVGSPPKRLDSHYTGWISVGDFLSPNALAVMAHGVEQTAAEVLYSDESTFTHEGEPPQPIYKPDDSPETRLAMPGAVGQLLLVHRNLLKRCPPFLPDAMDAAVLPAATLTWLAEAGYVAHVPEVLYHRQTRPTDVLMNEWHQGRQTVAMHLAQHGLPAQVTLGTCPGTYRLDWPITPLPHGPLPRVSILIPFRDKPDLLARCLSSLIQHTAYPHWEVIGLDNGSVEPATRQVMQHWAQDTRIRFVSVPGPFNFAHLNNVGAQHAQGQYLVLMNNDVAVKTHNWLEALLGYAQQPQVGAVGAKLLFADGTIQHMGIVIGLNGLANHPFRGLPTDHPGYMNRLHIAHNVAAVTGALLMVKKSLYQLLGGLDETLFPVDYNDVDFCLRLLAKGYRNVIHPHVVALHDESQSIGNRRQPHLWQQHQQAKRAFRHRHARFLKAGDPYYHPQLSLEGPGYEPKTRPTQLLFKTKLKQTQRLYVYYQKPYGIQWMVRHVPAETLPQRR